MNWHLYIGLIVVAFGVAGTTTMTIALLLVVLHKFEEELYARLKRSIQLALWLAVFATILGCALIANAIH